MLKRSQIVFFLCFVCACGVLFAAPPDSTTVGDRFVLVLPVEFSDQQAGVTVSQWDSFFNDKNYSGFTNASSVNEYFVRQSEGKLSLFGVVAPLYVAQSTLSYYTDESKPFTIRSRELVNEALENLKAKGFDFSQADGNSDGKVDSVMLLYAGTNSNAVNKGLYPHFVSHGWTSGQGTDVESFILTDMKTVPSLDDTVRLLARSLCDFPVLYDTDGSSLGIYTYGLMGLDGSDTNPVNVNAYLKYKAGWADVTNLSNTITGRRAVQVDNNHFYRFVNPGNALEYYLVEVKNSGYGYEAGSALPDDGLMIWHIDESTTASNNSESRTQTEHYEATVVQSDNAWHLENGVSVSFSNDLFDRSFNTQFSSASSPAAVWWDGTSSEFVISDLGDKGQSMTFVLGSTDPYIRDEVPLLGISRSTKELFYDIADTGSFKFGVYNQGGGILFSTLSSDQSWMTLSSTESGEISTNASLFTVNVDSSGLLPGIHSGNITITSGSGSDEKLAVYLTIYTTPSIQVSTDVIDLSVDSANELDSVYIALSNAGQGHIGYTITTDASWLVPNKLSGNMRQELDLIEFQIDAKTWSSGSYTATANLTTSGIVTQSTMITFNLTVNSDPPLSVSTYPSNGSTGVLVQTTLALEFDEDIYAGSGNLELRKASDDSLVEVIQATDATQVSITGNQLVVTPLAPLTTSTDFYVTWSSNLVCDMASDPVNPLTSKTAWTFQTEAGDAVAPVSQSFTPADGETGVFPGDDLVISFDETVVIGSGTMEIRKYGDDTVVLSVDYSTDVISTNGNEFRLTLAQMLPTNFQLYAIIPSGFITDLYGNAWGGITVKGDWDFTTGDSEIFPRNGVMPYYFETPAGSDAAWTVENYASAYEGSQVLKSGAISDGQESHIQITTYFEAGEYSYWVKLESDWNEVSFVVDGFGTTFYDIIPWTSNSGTFTKGLHSFAIKYIQSFGMGDAQTAWVDLVDLPLDTTFPTFVQSTPYDNQVAFPTYSPITLTFDEPMAHRGQGNVVIRYSSDNTVWATFASNNSSRVAFSGNNIVITPVTSFEPLTEYYVEISTNAFSDKVGHEWTGIQGNTALNFTVDKIDVTSPQISAMYPYDGSAGVQVDTFIRAYFNELVYYHTGSVSVKDYDNDTVYDTFSIPSSEVVFSGGNVMTITPSTNLPAGKHLYIAFTSNTCKDGAGNYFEGLTDKNFWDFYMVGDDTLQVHLQFDESSGSASNDGMLQGSYSPVNGAWNPDSGRFNGAIFLDEGYLDLGNPDELNFDAFTNDFTVSLWFKTTDTGTLYFFTKAEGSTNEQIFSYKSGGRIQGRVGGSVYPSINIGEGGISDGNWHLFTMASDASERRFTLYFDGGELAGGQQLSSSMQLTLGTFGVPTIYTHIIGARHDGDNSSYLYPFQGFVDDARIYSRKLTDLEVANLYIQPTIISLSPANGDIGVGKNEDLVIGMSTDAMRGSGNIYIKKMSDDSVAETIQAQSSKVTLIGNVLTVNPSMTFSSEDKYYVEIEGEAIMNMSATPFMGISGNTTWAFTVEDYQMPTAVTFMPPSAALEVSTQSNLYVYFDEDITTGSGNIEILHFGTDTQQQLIDASSSALSVSGNMLTINPPVDFTLNDYLYVLITSGTIQDLSGNPYAGLSAKTQWNFQATQPIPPVFQNGTPNASNIDYTQFDLTVQIDEDGRVYYVVVADGAFAPTVNEVKGGQESGGGAPVQSGQNASVTAATDVVLSVSGLTAGASYDVYVVAEDVGGNLQNSPTKVDVTMKADDIPPGFVLDYPRVASVSKTTVAIEYMLDELGDFYYVVISDEDTAPTANEIKNGQKSGGGAPLQSGYELSVPKETLRTTEITGLTVATNYDIYFVIEDAGANQRSVILLDVRTQDEDFNLIYFGDFEGATINYPGAQSISVSAANKNKWWYGYSNPSWQIANDGDDYAQKVNNGSAQGSLVQFIDSPAAGDYTLSFMLNKPNTAGTYFLYITTAMDGASIGGSDPGGTYKTFVSYNYASPATTGWEERTVSFTWTADEVASDYLLVYFRAQNSSTDCAIDDVVLAPDTLPVVLTTPSVNAFVSSTTPVYSGTAVSLEASAVLASSGGGSFSKYLWQQISGPAVSLNSTNTTESGFTAPSVINPTNLIFRFLARDSAGYENYDDVTVLVNPVQSTPNAPSGLIAMAYQGPENRLEWTDNSLDESEFRIYVSTDDSDYVLLMTTNSNITVSTDATVESDQIYYYRVSAYNEIGESTWSSASVISYPFPPVAVSNLSAVADSDTQITLTWIDVSTTEDGYYIYRSTDDFTTSNLLSDEAANTNSYVDAGLIEATTYSYIVAPYGSGGATASEIVSVRTPDLVPPGFLSTYPNLTNIGKESLDVNISMDEGADIFMVIVSSGATAPSISQIKAGNDATDSSPIGGGNLTGIPATSEVTISASGLADNTPYDIYIILEDIDGNVRGPILVNTLTYQAGSNLVSDGDFASGALTFTSVDVSPTAGNKDFWYYCQYNTSWDVVSGYASRTGSQGAMFQFFATPTAGTYNLSYDMQKGAEELRIYVSTMTETDIYGDNPDAPPNSSLYYLDHTGSIASWTTITDTFTLDANHGGDALMILFRARNWDNPVTPIFIDNVYVSNQPAMISNVKPVALAQADFTAYESTLVTIEGNATDTEDSSDALNYLWQQISGPSVSLTVLSSTQASFNAPAVVSPTTVMFRFSAEDTSGHEGFDDLAILINPVTTLPNPPSGLIVSSHIGPDNRLEWTDNSLDEGGFRVYASTDDIAYSLVMTTSSNITVSTHSSVTPETMYYYRVAAYNKIGESTYVSASVTSYTGAPQAVSNLTATADSDSQITLSWTDVATSEDGYYIYRSTDNFSSYVVHSTEAANSTSFVDTGLISATTYYYQVAGYSSGGATPSATVYAWTDDVIAPIVLSTYPTIESADFYVYKSLELQFDENVFAGSGSFYIYQSTDNTLVDTVSGNSPQILFNGDSVSIDPVIDLTDNAQYYVLADSGVFTDEYGNAWTGVNSIGDWSFTVTPSLISTTLIVTSDTSIRSSRETYNYGASTGLGINTAYRTLLYFDMSSLPVNVQVYSATLRMTSSSSNAEQTLNAYQIAAANVGWIEGSGTGATTASSGEPTYGYHQYATQTWAGSAGLNTSNTDYIESTHATSVWSTTNVEIDLTTMAQDWYTNPTSNAGVRIHAVTGFWPNLNSKEAAVSDDKKPHLFIQYKILDDLSPPTAISLSPPNNTTSVSLATSMTIGFSESITTGSGNLVLKSKPSDSVVEVFDVASGDAVFATTEVTITPATPLAEGTWFYIAITSGAIQDMSGNGYSGFSQSSAWTFKTTGYPPLAPTNLVATSASQDQIDLTWTDNSTNEGGFYLYRSPDNTTFTLISTPAADATSYSDTGLATNTPYYYALAAYNDFGITGNTAIAMTTTADLLPPVINTPSYSNVELDSAQAGGNVASVGSGNIERRGVFWSLGSGFADGTGTEVFETGDWVAESFMVPMSGLPSGTTIFFKAYAANYASTSYTAESSFLTKPSTPTGLTADWIAHTSMELSWSAVTGADNYTLAVSTTSDFAAMLSGYDPMQGITATTALVSGLYGNTEYWYKVLAVNNTGGSPYTDAGNSITLTTNAPTVLYPDMTSLELTTAVLAGNLVSVGDAAVTERGFYISDSSGFSIGGATKLSETGTWSSPEVFSLEASGLAAGNNYYYVAFSTNVWGQSLTTENSFLLKPSTPTLLDPTDVYANSITINWSPVNGASSYKLYVDDANDFATPLAGYNPMTGITSTSEIVTGLTLGTSYWYKVIAVNASGDSPESVIGTTDTIAGTPPTVETPLASSIEATTALAGGNISSIGSGNVTERGVYYSTASGFAFGSASKVFETGDWSSVAVFDIELTTLISGTTIYFKAYAMNAYGMGNTVEASFLTKPQAPSGLSAINLTSLSLDLNWSTVYGADGYEISVDDNSDFSSPLAGYNPKTLAGNTDSLTGLQPGTAYYVKALAYNTSGNSLSSSIYTTTTSDGDAPIVDSPAYSSIVFTSATLGGNLVSTGLGTITERGIYWSTTTGFTDGEGVKVSESGIWSTTGAFTLSVTDMYAGNTIYFKAYATNAWGTGYSTENSFLLRPSSPTGLIATNVTAIGFTAGWAVTTGASTYNLYVDDASDFATPLGGYNPKTAIAGNSDSISGLTPGGTYWYKVFATNATGDSFESDVASVTLLTGSPPTIDLTTYSSVASTTAIAGGNITQVGTDNVSEKGIYWSTQAGFANGEGVKVSSSGSWASPELFYTEIDSLVAGNTIYIKAFASNSYGTTYAPEVSFLTIPPAPIALSGNSIAQTSFQANWQPANGAATYELYVSSGSGFTELATGYNPMTAIAGNTQTVSGLYGNTNYYYQVIAVNATGNSSASNSVNVVTLTTDAPTVLYPFAVSIAQTTVLIGGNITDVGDDAVSMRGIYWSTQSGFADGAGSKVNESGWWTVANTTFALNATGMPAGNQIFFKAFAENMWGTAYSTEGSIQLAPADPVAIAATNTSDFGFQANWNSANGASTYNLYVSTDSGLSGYLSGYAPLTGITGTTSWVTVGYGNTSYYYAVEAINATGNSALSNIQSIVTLTTDGPMVMYPTYASVEMTTAILGGNIISVGDANVTERGLYWDTTSGFADGAGTKVSETGNWASGAVFTLEGSSLPAGTIVYFKAFASNAYSVSYSTEASFLTKPTTPITLPASLITDVSFRANWTEVTGAEGYMLNVDDNSDFSSPLAGFPMPVSTNFGDVAGLTGSNTYYYIVYATNATGSSPTSTSASAVTLAGAPPVITWVEESSVGQTTAVVGGNIFSIGGANIDERGIFWSSLAGFADGEGEKISEAGSWAVPNAYTASLTGLPSGNQIYYKAYATNAFGTGYSTETSLLTIASTPTVNAASNILPWSFDVSWTTVFGAEGYAFYLATDSGFANPVTGYNPLAVNGNTLTASGLNIGTTYWYRVASTNASGFSPVSSALSAITITTNPPTIVYPEASQIEQTTAVLAGNITVIGDGSVTARGVVWSTQSGFAEGEGEITTESGTWSSPVAFSLEASSMPVGNTIYFKAWATNAYGTSYTTEGSFLLKPATPAGLMALSTAPNSYTATWNPSNGAATYSLYVSTVASFASLQSGYGPLTSIAGNSQAVSGLAAGTQYYYRVEAVNATGSSPYSESDYVITVSTGAPSILYPELSSVGSTTATLQANVISIGDGNVLERGFYWDYSSGFADGAGTKVSETGDWSTGSVFTITGTTLPAGNTIYVKMFASNVWAVDYTTEVSVTLLPTTPTALAASLTTWNSFQANWESTTGATSYELYVSTESSFASHLPSYAPMTGIAGSTQSVDGLNAGTNYWYRLLAVNAAGNSELSDSVSVVTLTTNAPTVMYPSMSSLYVTTAILGGNITDIGDANVTEAGVYWSDTSGFADGAGTKVSSVVNYSTGQTFTQALSSLDAGTTLYFKAFATNAYGTGYSTESSILTVSTAPTGLIASGISSSDFTAGWTATTGASSYAIWVSTVSDFSSAVSGYNPLTGIAGNSQTVSGLSVGTTYYYRIAADNASGRGPVSETGSMTTLTTNPPTVEGASLLTIGETTATLQGNIVSIGDSNVTERGFYWDTTSGFADGAGTKVSEAGSWSSTGLHSLEVASLPSGTTVFFKGFASNAYGTDYSTQSSLLTLSTAPDSLAEVQVTTTTIDLMWTTATGATGYYLYLATDSNFLSPVSGYNPNSTTGNTASIGGLISNTTYYAKVSSVNASGEGVASATLITATTPAIPADPANLVAVALTTNSIALTWTDNSIIETGYFVYRSADNSTFTAVSTEAADSTSYTDTGLTHYTPYYYYVVANSTDGTSANSNVAMTTTVMDVPYAPSGLAGSASSAFQVDLSWTDNSFTEDGFLIERSSTSGSGFGIVGNVTATTSFSDTTALVQLSTYYYRVIAFNSMGNSSASSELMVVTLDIGPTAPSGLTATSASSSQIDLSWTDNSNNEDGFYIERSADASFTTVSTFSVSTDVTAYSDTGLTHDTQYWYRVMAYNGIGNSIYTASASEYTWDIPPVPPTNLTAVSVSTDTISLEWTDASSNETGFTLQRSSDSGSSWVAVQILVADTTSFTDEGLISKTTYSYRLYGSNTYGDGSTSVEYSTRTTSIAPQVTTNTGFTVVEGGIAILYSTQFSASDADDSTNDLSYELVSLPVSGSLYTSGFKLAVSSTVTHLDLLNAQVLYQHDGSEVLSDSFAIQPIDPESVVGNSTTIGITVTPVNDKPYAMDQTVSTTEDTPLAIVLSGTDADSVIASYSIESSPSNGSLTGTAPNLTYTPNANWHGTDSFTFRVSDGSLLSTTVATVTITVSPVNDVPVASSLSFVAVINQSQTVNLDGTDADGDALTYTIVSLPTLGALSGSGASLTYLSSLVGTDTFTYKVNDGTADSGTGTVTIEVKAVNNAPVVSPISIATAEDTPVAVALAGIDPDGDPLTYILNAAPQHGTLSGTTPNLTYTPDANWNGTETFLYSVTDGAATSVTAMVTITVSAVNDAPIANNMSVSTVEDLPVDIALDATDPEGDNMFFEIVTPPSLGSLMLSGSTASYTPPSEWSGAETFIYRTSDGQGWSNNATVTVSVLDANDPPTVKNVTYIVDKNIPYSFTLTATDPDSATLVMTTVTSPSYGKLSGVMPNLTYTPNNTFTGYDSFTYRSSDGGLWSGTATITLNVVNSTPTAYGLSLTGNEDMTVSVVLMGTDPNNDPLTYTTLGSPLYGTLSGTVPNLTYTPNPDWHGTDSFSYEVRDDQFRPSLSTTVTIVIQPVNDAPVAQDMTVTVVGTTNRNLVLLGSDVDGDALSWYVLTNPTMASLYGTAPNLTVTASNGATGSESFSVWVSDGAASDTATITLNYSTGNSVPIATSTSVAINEDTTRSFDMTKLATDANGDTLSFWLVSGPSNGMLKGTTPNLTYTPNLNWYGTETIVFRVSDGLAYSNDATITITVLPVNDAPVANSASYFIPLGVGKFITLSGSDVDGDSLTYRIVANPNFGKLTGIAPKLAYRPSVSVSRIDSFRFVVNDGKVDSSVAIIDLDLRPDLDKDGLVDDVEDNDNDGDGYANSVDLYPADFDNDGIDDINDPDIDNDGIANEDDKTMFGKDTSRDTDNDGLMDEYDSDMDGDGIPNSSDAMPRDTDNDGVDNAFDDDRDGDNIKDSDELLVGLDFLNADTNRDGIADGVGLSDNDMDGYLDIVDTDGDGSPDLPDTDGDGIPDALDPDWTTHSSAMDTDGDGTVDSIDPDDDGDTIADTEDRFPWDMDNDGIPDNRDADIDGDGRLDSNEPGMERDFDNDGIPDAVDSDIDGDGIPNHADVGILGENLEHDADNDGKHNGIDDDDDNDGVPDTREWELGSNPLNADTNGDGVNDVDSTVDSDGDGIIDSVDSAPTIHSSLTNTDEYGLADHADPDIDGDGIPNNLDLYPYDTDNDGIYNSVDTDIDGDGILNTAESSTDAIYDLDNDGKRDRIDEDIDGDGIPNVLEADVGGRIRNYDSLYVSGLLMVPESISDLTLTTQSLKWAGKSGFALSASSAKISFENGAFTGRLPAVRLVDDPVPLQTAPVGYEKINLIVDFVGSLNVGKTATITLPLPDRLNLELYSATDFIVQKFDETTNTWKDVSLSLTLNKTSRNLSFTTDSLEGEWKMVSRKIQSGDTGSTTDPGTIPEPPPPTITPTTPASGGGGGGGCLLR